MMFNFKRSPATDPTALLNLLCKFGWITHDQKHEALAKKRTRMIGETLVDLGMIAPHQLDQALIQQQAARGQLKKGELTKLVGEQASKEQEQLIEAARDLERIANKSGKFMPIKRSEPSGDDT